MDALLQYGKYEGKWYTVEGNETAPFTLNFLQYYTYEIDPCTEKNAKVKVASKRMFQDAVAKADIMILNHGKFARNAVFESNKVIFPLKFCYWNVWQIGLQKECQNIEGLEM